MMSSKKMSTIISICITMLFERFFSIERIVVPDSFVLIVDHFISQISFNLSVAKSFFHSGTQRRYDNYYCYVYNK